MGPNGPKLFLKLVECVDVSKCESMDLTNMIYALGLVGYLNETFFKKVTAEVLKRMQAEER